MKTTVLLLLVLVGVTPSASAQSEYVVGAQDVLSIAVYDQADLTGQFTVDEDGSLTFPLVGRVMVAGRTVRDVEAELHRLLADGFLKNPQVSASIAQYHSQRLFVMGEVRAPGAYPLTGNMSIIEAIARAGGTTPQAAEEVLIVRPSSDDGGDGPRAADAEDATVIRVNVAEIQSGELSMNVSLHGGDTVVVQRAQGIYVFGQVKAPGSYPIEKGMTVLQALSLAGGVTDRGSTGRINVVRTVDGKKEEMKVKLADVVEPGDTIIVKERFF
jgi:polysaccharide biosynthesis/export protein